MQNEELYNFKTMVENLTQGVSSYQSALKSCDNLTTNISKLFRICHHLTIFNCLSFSSKLICLSSATSIKSFVPLINHKQKEILESIICLRNKLINRNCIPLFVF